MDRVQERIEERNAGSVAVHDRDEDQQRRRRHQRRDQDLLEPIEEIEQERPEAAEEMEQPGGWWVVRHARACRGHPRPPTLILPRKRGREGRGLKTWMAPQLGLARVAHIKLPQVG